jgi:hypothetical protein
MVRTLVEPKKSSISSMRKKLLALGFSEEVEFDPIEIEPVMIYSKSGERTVFLKHKWATVALVLLISPEKEKELSEKFPGLLSNRLEENLQDGTRWMRFSLPQDEEEVIETLNFITKDSG